MILVGLISNDERVHQKIKKLLLYNHTYSITFVCNTLNEYKQKATGQQMADILIIDGREDESDTLIAVRYLNTLSSLKIVVLMATNNPGIVLQMIRAGAVGFVSHPFNTDTLLLCLQNIAAKKGYLDEGTLLKVFDIINTEEKEQTSILLSEREQEIIQLITKGFTNKEIGEKLHISHHTVNEHLKKIYRRFDVNSRGRLIHKVSGLTDRK